MSQSIDLIRFSFTKLKCKHNCSMVLLEYKTILSVENTFFLRLLRLNADLDKRKMNENRNGVFRYKNHFQVQNMMKNMNLEKIQIFFTPSSKKIPIFQKQSWRGVEAVRCTLLMHKFCASMGIQHMEFSGFWMCSHH